MRQTVPVVLASNSPRRKELLKGLGIEFSVMVSEAEEITSETEPEKIVTELSKIKGNAVLHRALETDPDTVVISSDTIVFLNGKVLGKPKDKEDCIRMIQSLSGKSHFVYTGVTLFYSDHGTRTSESFVKAAKVKVQPITESEILEYAETAEPYDKAGGYGIQGAFSRFITGIEGDYYTIMGLPVNELYNKCKEKGFLFG